MYSSTYAYKKVSYSRRGMTDATHTVTVDRTGILGAGGYANVSLDAVDVVGTLLSDTIPPVTTSDANSTWRSTNATVTLAATDVGWGVSLTRYRINGSALATYTTPFAVSAQGTNAIDFFSIDKAGNVEATKTATVRIDRVAPATSDNAPLGWTRGPVAVSLVASDADSGVASTCYSLDGTTPSIPTTSGVVTISAEGTTTLRYASVDTAGNTEAPRSATVRIDDTAPVTTDDAPTGWIDGPATVHLTASDAMSGLSGIRVSVNGSAATTYTTGIVVSAEGTTSIAYAGIDAAGNAEATKTAVVRIDHTAPTTADDAPAGWVTGPVLVSLTASDSVSGTSVTYYSTDGTYPTLPYAGGILVSAQGATTLRYYSVDVRGNAETPKSATVSAGDHRRRASFLGARTGHGHAFGHRHRVRRGLHRLLHRRLGTLTCRHLADPALGRGHHDAEVRLDRRQGQRGGRALHARAHRQHAAGHDV